jgi:hypothetical protein
VLRTTLSPGADCGLPSIGAGYQNHPERELFNKDRLSDNPIEDEPSSRESELKNRKETPNEE